MDMYIIQGFICLIQYQVGSLIFLFLRDSYGDFGF